MRALAVTLAGLALLLSCTSGASDEARSSSGGSGCNGNATPKDSGVGDCPAGQTACHRQAICTDLITDPKNCGACGKTCAAGTTCRSGGCRCGPDGLGEVCSNGPIGSVKGSDGDFCGEDLRCRTRTTIPTLGYAVTAIAVGSDGFSFVTTSVQATSLVVQKAVGTNTALVLGTGTTVQLTTNGPDLVYTASGASGPSETVGCPGGACGPVLAPEPKVVEAFGAHAYWLGSASVERCSITGCPGGPETVGAVPAGATSLRVDASGVYLLYPSMLGAIRAGGVFEVLAPLTAAVGLAINADRVFVKSASGFSVCAKTGCTGAATAFLAAKDASLFVVDDANLYWVSGGKLSRCPANAIACATPVPMLTSNAKALSQDAKNLYVGRDDGLDIYTK